MINVLKYSLFFVAFIFSSCHESKDYVPLFDDYLSDAGYD